MAWCRVLNQPRYGMGVQSMPSSTSRLEGRFQSGTYSFYHQQGRMRCNLSDKELKVMVIKMLTGFEEQMNNQEVLHKIKNIRK